MEIFGKLDSWDYLALFMLLASLCLICGGVSKLQAANPERVDASKLKVRAYGAAIASAAYLICHYLA